MTVLTTAWKAAGVDSAGGDVGACARCSRQGPLTPAREVVSKTFTAYDSWARPSGRGLCPACTWGYSSPELRSSIHLITREPAAVHACTRQQARRLLEAVALPVDHVLVVPLRPGRKHLLPDADWGRIVLDDAQISWTTDDAQRLRTLRQLREHGFGTRMLRAPSPPFAVLQRLPAGTWASVMDAWRALAPWRTDVSPWLDVALHLTMPTTKELS